MGNGKGVNISYKVVHKTIDLLKYEKMETIKKHMVLIALVILSLSVMNLKAQDSPNGAVTPGGNVTELLPWYRTGNSQSSGIVNNMLGFTTATPIRFCTSNTNRLYIGAEGLIGVNTTNPLQMLHVVEGNILISASSNRAPGSINGSLLFGSDPTSTNPYGRWGIEYVGNADDGYGLNFWKPYNSGSGGNGLINNVLFLKDDGNVGIGTKNPQAKLAVNGGILAKSVRVNTSSSYWPDYVFCEEYELMDLSDLEAYIKAYRHLPGVPSAEEVAEQGDVDLGEMNAILLEKVEELTRYVIELRKQIDELKK